jgi:tetratricopeptide (TPR) repeat protein
MDFNPVEQRLLDLAGHWETFREDASKRLLVWQAEPNALRFYQCFFEVQKHETDYTVGDLFVVFGAPFENAMQYSRDLKKALAGQYEASRDDLIQQGITPDWQFSPEELPDSAAGFVHSLQSFGSKHYKRIGHLVAVLMPTDVADDDSFASWLTRALDARLPERLRFAVIDSLETPRLSRLIASKHELIHADTPKIDALTTAQETFAQEGAVGPAGVFRNLLMGLMTLVEKGSAAQVKVVAADALKFARKQKWADQEVVVTMLVAGALLKEKRFDEAVKGYQDARQAAAQAVVDGHPSGQQLVLQNWFGEAGVHLAAGEPGKAVECYDQAAVLAQQIHNLILGIEAFRMGAFCLARMDAREPAIVRGNDALLLGQQLKPEARRISRDKR